MFVKSTVKKANQPIPLTEEQILEIIKCKDDPEYFIETYCKIVDSKTKAVIPFSLFDCQKGLINGLRNHKKNICLWARQLGKTEVAAAYMLWYATFHSKVNVLIVAHKFEHVQMVLQRVKFMYEMLPDWIKAGVLQDGYNVRSIKFENGSSIKGTATTENAGRGSSIDLLYIDEFAFVRASIGKEFWASVQPTLSTTNGQCLITSTPSSDDDMFAQLWFGAINNVDEFGNETELGRNGFKAHFADWTHHPARDEVWVKEQKLELGDDRFDREQNCKFISFDETLINPVFINEEFRKMEEEPLFKSGNVRWYKKIEPNKMYLLALDPSVGVGRDNAAIQIFQMPECIQVGEWCHNKTRMPQQVKLLKDLIDYIYDEMANSPLQVNEPEIYWSVENNTIGEATLNAIEAIGEDEFMGTFISQSSAHGRTRLLRKGFTTTNRSKLAACVKMKSLIEEHKMKISSKALLRELKFFVANGNSFRAKVGEKDDLVLALILIIRMLDEMILWDEDIYDMMTDVDDDFTEPMPTFIL